MFSLILLLLPAALCADIDGRKGFETYWNNGNAELRQDLDFTLNRELAGRGSLRMDYDDTNPFNGESLRSLLFDYQTLNGRLQLGDQCKTEDSGFGLELPATRALNWQEGFGKGDFNLFYAAEERDFVREEFEGGGRRGPYLLSRAPVTQDSEKVTVGDMVQEPNMDYTIDYESGLLFFNRVISSAERIGVYYRPVTPNDRHDFLSCGYSTGVWGLTLTEEKANLRGSGDDSQLRQMAFNSRMSGPAGISAEVELAAMQTSNADATGYRMKFSKDLRGSKSIKAGFVNLGSGFTPLSRNPEYQGGELVLSHEKGEKAAQLYIKNYDRYVSGSGEIALVSAGGSFNNSWLETEARIEEMGKEKRGLIHSGLRKPGSGYRYFYGYVSRFEDRNAYYYQLQDTWRLHNGGRLHGEILRLNEEISRKRIGLNGELPITRELFLTLDAGGETVDSVRDHDIDCGLAVRRFGCEFGGGMRNSGSGEDSAYLKTAFRWKQLSFYGRWPGLDAAGYDARINWIGGKVRLYCSGNSSGGSDSLNGGMTWKIGRSELKFAASDSSEQAARLSASIGGAASGEWNWRVGYELNPATEDSETRLTARMEYLIF